MNIILQRSFTGGIYILLIIVSLLIHPIAFALVTALLNFLALLEVRRIGEKLIHHSYSGWIVINSLFILTSSVLISLEFKSYAWALIILLLVIQFVLPLYIKNEDTTANLLIPLFGSLYVSFPLILMNLIQGYSAFSNLPLMLAVFVIIWTGDTFAYLSGMAFGKHKLFERVSPKKTWEGFIGGMLMSVAASLTFHYFYPEKGLMFWVALAVVTTIAALFGDFTESMLKRKAQIKDSGSILPGHGGILDRIDSVLLVSPVIYIYLLLL